MNLFSLLKPRPKVWLARNFVNGDYVICVGKKPSEFGGYWKSWANHVNGYPYIKSISLCNRFFEEVTPKSCLMNPGDGPVEIKLSIKQSLYNNCKRMVMLKIARCILVGVQSNILLDSGFGNFIRRIFPSFPNPKWCDHLGFVGHPWSLSKMPCWHVGYNDIRGRQILDLYHGYYYGDECPVCLYGETSGWRARRYINIVLIRAFGKTLNPNVKPGTFVIKGD